MERHTPDHLVREFNIVRDRLVGDFIYACRKYPNVFWEQIPEAKCAMENIKEFEKFVEKYFGYVYNMEECIFEKEVEVDG